MVEKIKAFLKGLFGRAKACVTAEIKDELKEAKQEACDWAQAELARIKSQIKEDN